MAQIKIPSEVEMLDLMVRPLVEKMGMLRATAALAAAGPPLTALKDAMEKAKATDPQLVEDILIVVDHFAITTLKLVDDAEKAKSALKT